MKRVISLVLALVLVLSLAVMICSCGEKGICIDCQKEKNVKDMKVVANLSNEPYYMCKRCINENMMSGKNMDKVIHDLLPIAECNTCGEEKLVKDMTKVLEMGDYTVYICHDCENAVEDAIGDIGDLFE